MKRFARLVVIGSLGVGVLAAFACGSSSDDGASQDGNDGGGGSSGDGSSTTSGDGGNVVTPGFSKVGTGEYETLYLVDGVVYGYGGGCGLLGQGKYSGSCIPPHPIDTPAGLKFSDVQGGLHQSEAVDVNGHAWTWGESDQGLQGSGVDGGIGDGSEPYMITKDSTGADFDHVIAVEPTSAFDSALKSDGTVWVWGNCAGGVAGDGTKSGIIQTPTKVPLPAGVFITKISGSSQLYALDSTGTVWGWGPSENNYLGTANTGTTDVYSPQKIVNLPANIVDIATGFASFQYALTSDGDLWGWGYRGAYLGLGSDAGGSYFPTQTPIDLKTVLNLPAPVKVLSTDFMTTHVILSDGSLWGWGDDAMGLVGDGRELDFSKTNPPYAWDYGQFEVPAYKPIRIAPSVSNFVNVWGNSAYDFYDYAITADGKIYSWGRNKTGTLGNGVYPDPANGDAVGLGSEMAAAYPNSWDVTTATLVDPMNSTPHGANSPECIANPDAGSCH